MSGNPYQKYKEEAVMTMTPGEMLLLLYDELLKRLTLAELYLDKEKFDEFEKQVTRSEEIIRYLKETLDFQYPISRELYQMYDFFLVELSRAHAARKKELLMEVRRLAQELREAFGEAEKKVSG